MTQDSLAVRGLRSASRSSAVRGRELARERPSGQKQMMVALGGSGWAVCWVSYGLLRVWGGWGGGGGGRSFLRVPNIFPLLCDGGGEHIELLWSPFGFSLSATMRPQASSWGLQWSGSRLRAQVTFCPFCLWLSFRAPPMVAVGTSKAGMSRVERYAKETGASHS